MLQRILSKWNWCSLSQGIHLFLLTRFSANIERDVTVLQEIISSSEYRGIIEIQGPVFVMRSDLDVFKIKECRRFFIRHHSDGRNYEMRGELVYKHGCILCQYY